MQKISELETLTVRVADARMLSSAVRMVRLETIEAGGHLPAFTPGAHINVAVRLADGGKDWRQYSLIDLGSREPEWSLPRNEYVIAIRLDDKGRGGSRFMHRHLNSGDLLEIKAPRNDFPLKNGSHRAFLVAGGIGVTPLASMAAYGKSAGRPVSMLYAGRSRDSMALLEELGAMLGDDLRIHADEDAGKPINIAELFDEFAENDDVYVCGPTPMLDAMIDEAVRRGWPRDRLNFELFAAATNPGGDHAFELKLAQSGRVLHVPADKSILDVLIDAGLDPVYDCKRGECGVCAVGVMSGEVDHRDYVLTEREKLANNVLHTCVSRCKGLTLAIDL